MQAEYSEKMGHDLPVSRPPRRRPCPRPPHTAPPSALTTPCPPPVVAQVPPELVLAVYTTHAIARSNTTHLFGELSMGQGRLPVSEGEQERHIAALARALAVAVARDFGAGRASIEGVDIDAPLIDDLARKHRALLYAQQRGLARARRGQPPGRGRAQGGDETDLRRRDLSERAAPASARTRTVNIPVIVLYPPTPSPPRRRTAPAA